MKKILCIFTMLALLSVQTVQAIDLPEFPHCANPGGTVVAKYDSGIHGVPGNPTTFSGKDTVYKLDDKRIVQCLCLSDNTGIQTNYWKTSSLSQDEIETLRKLDWIFIPNGAAWGLDESSYMANNSTISCGATLSSSTANSGVGGGSVLGLAATGGQVELIGLSSLGIAILTAGILLKKRVSND